MKQKDGVSGKGDEEVQQQPGTLATQGSTQVEKSPDDSVFDAILGSTNELEEAFGI